MFNHQPNDESPDIMKNPIILSRPVHHFLMAGIYAVASLVCVIGLTGCLARTPLKQQTFVFGSPDVVATNPVVGNRVLAIRKLEVATPFAGRLLVYRTSEFNYVNDPYAAFLAAPEEELMAPVRAGLCREGGFSTVVGTGSALRANTLVEINVSQLYGDFRDPANAKAVLTMQFLFFKATKGVATKPLFQKEYSRSIALDQPSAAALMKGWNQGLNEILAEVLTDYQQAEGASK
jgi:cholesterol transport system auxiliary component